MRFGLQRKKLFPTIKDRPYIHTYQVFPTGVKGDGTRVGLMELVDSSEAFKSFEWKPWQVRANTDMVRRLVTSAAGAYIGGYVLGVIDRHWDNILIRNKHTLLHIDFGFLLGTQPPIDAPKFSISSDMKNALICVGEWNTFIDLAVSAYKVLRDRSKEVIRAGKLIYSLALDWEASAIEDYFNASLQLKLDEDTALSNIRAELEGSSIAWQNFFKQFSHKTIDPVWYGLLRRHFPPAVAIMSKVEDSSKEKAAAKKAKDVDGTTVGLVKKYIKESSSSEST